MSLAAFQALPDDEQDMWVDRQQHMCPQCHGDTRVCGDPARPWYPQRSICYRTREGIAADRRYEALHKDEPFHDGTYENSDWSKTADEDHPYRYDDGVNIWAAEKDLDPTGVWLLDADERDIPLEIDRNGDGPDADADIIDAAIDRLIDQTTDDALFEAFPQRKG